MLCGSSSWRTSKNVTVTYDPTGSGSGIEAVKNGTADIGLASRSLKDEEKADGLTETVIALDGIAVIVNAQSNGHGPDRGADRQDLHR